MFTLWTHTPYLALTGKLRFALSFLCSLEKDTMECRECTILLFLQNFIKQITYKDSLHDLQQFPESLRVQFHFVQVCGGSVGMLIRLISISLNKWGVIAEASVYISMANAKEM